MGIGKAVALRGIARYLPILNWLPKYQSAWLQADLLVGVVVLGTLEGIVVAVMVSMAALIYEVNRPPVYAVARKPGTDVFRPLADHPGDETLPGMLLLRTEGMLHFARAPSSVSGKRSARPNHGRWCWTVAPSPTSNTRPSACCPSSKKGYLRP
jgi:MFS superfamily sulfate permease-like transporter